MLCYCKEGNLSWSLIGVKRFKEKTGLSILTDLDKWNMFIPPVVGHHLKFYIWWMSKMYFSLWKFHSFWLTQWTNKVEYLETVWFFQKSQLFQVNEQEVILKSISLIKNCDKTFLEIISRLKKWLNKRRRFNVWTVLSILSCKSFLPVCGFIDATPLRVYWH